MARNLVEWGANIVLGHHSHWVQGFNEYKGSPIFYSLGNFYFPQLTYEKKLSDGTCQTVSLELTDCECESIIPQLEINIDKGIANITTDIIGWTLYDPSSGKISFISGNVELNKKINIMNHWLQRTLRLFGPLLPFLTYPMLKPVPTLSGADLRLLLPPSHTMLPNYEWLDSFLYFIIRVICSFKLRRLIKSIKRIRN